MNPKLVRVVGVVAGASLDGMRAVVSSLRSGTPVGTMMGYIERYGVKKGLPLASRPSTWR